ncbi:MAG: glyoxalase [Cyanobacteria bacterium RYN_339]|nr:glyoxalase [Cyanobacteria bacterium RYN_339]
MTVQFLHTKLRVRSLDAAVAFYQAAFGYELRSRRPGPGTSEIAFLTLAGQAAELQLAQDVDDLPVPLGLVHLAFKVEDLEASLAAAQAAGAALVSGPYELPSGSRVAFLRDLDGYDLELVKKKG